MKKAKALMAFAFNIKILSKVPAVIKSTLEGLKGDLEEIQEAVNQVKSEQPAFKQHGTSCGAANVKDPVPCYKRIYGPIKYNMAQRTAWEEEMKKIVWHKFSKHFDPMQYPLTDLVEETATK